MPDAVTGEASGGAADHFPLPPAKHVPGVNLRPADGFLDAVIERGPAETRAEEAPRNVVWQYGIRLINSGYFWEAHEVLEPVWSRAAPNSRERFLVQGVIHLANAALKVRMGRPKAAERLTALALECLDRAGARDAGRLMGIDPGEVSAAASRIREGKDSIRISVEFDAI